MRKKIIGIIFIILLVSILILPIAFINTNPNAISYRENRGLHPFPSLNLPFDEFKSQFSAWFNDHLGFRDQLLDMRTNILFNGLGIVSSDLVHKGKDGWYYYKGDNNLDIATGDYVLTENTLKAILEKNKRIQEKLKEKGVDYVVVLPVSKVSIYPEYMGIDNACIRRTPVDIVADYLETNSDIKVIRLKQTLLDHKNDTKLFFKTDTHWTEEGAYIAYKKIISNLKEWGLCNTNPVEVDFVDSFYKGEFSNMLGNINALPEEATKKVVIRNQHAVKNEQNNRYNEISYALAQAGHLNPWYHYENKSINTFDSVVWYGDSLFGSWNATENLAENFAEFTYVWSYEMDEHTIDLISPDLVVFEMGERYLNTIPNRNIPFTRIPIDNIEMEVVGTKISGDNLTVKIKNMGNSIWSEYDAIRCQLVLNNNNTDYRAFIPNGIVVNPMETIEFVFYSVGKVISDAKQVDIQMLQEGLWYYPQKYRIKG